MFIVFGFKHVSNCSLNIHSRFRLVFNVSTMDSKISPYFQESKPSSSKIPASAAIASPRVTRSRAAAKIVVSHKVKLEDDAEYPAKPVVNPKKIKTEVADIEGLVPDESNKWAPENWEVVYNNIKIMRQNMDAPVDTMGCDQQQDQDSPPEVKRFQVLVALMLSSQTKDQMTHAAMEKLKKHGLTIENVIKTEEDVLANLIYGVGFWKKKAVYIKKTAVILAEKYNYDIPDTVEELCKLPGVGPKMAVLCVNIGWNNVIGIGVDTHVHRIANWLGWTRTPTKLPEATQKALEEWVPRSLWGEMNHLLVGFGQTHCKPVKPLCHSCLNKDLCPVGKNPAVALLFKKSPKKSPKK